MNQNRWKTVNRIFHDALEVPSGERQSFVQAASGGDPDIQAEVEVLLKADEDAGSYLESPIIDQDFIANSLPPVQPGDVLCQRFQIVRAVGEGGMGHVFEAYDSELAVRVALKVVRSEIASNPAALARFRQEVRLARRITHPNVCRTFDIERDVRIVHAEHGTTQEVVFLTMEFLEGETLASRIKQHGPVPLSEAQETARQIAGALGAAHELGIIHRDMKPANIMLAPTKPGDAPGFRAVITDFGLARLDPVFSSGNLSALSHTARPIGTLAYMAPEQLENGPVSPATDIYALGLVLFEMVTGTRAFPSENFLSGIAQRLAGPPPSPQKLVPGLPQPWCRAIEGCLRTKPEERFQSAADVMAVLDGGKVRLPAARRRSFLSSLPPRRRMMALVAILVAAVALFAGAFRLYQTKADAKVAPGALIYLTQVKNQTGEKALDNVTELIRAGLAQSVQLNLLDTSRVGDILQQMTKPPDATIDAPTAREIAMRAGAVRVVFATVSGAGGNYKIDVDIEQPDNTPARYRNHWTRSFAWHSAPAAANGTIAPELLTAVRTASDWIRHEAGESANDIARLDVPPEDVTTSSWQALEDYAEAKHLLLANQPSDAVSALKSSVAADPNFALAYASLGDVLLALHREIEGYQAYDKALELGLQDRLTRREEDRIKGMRAVDTEDFQLAVDSFRDLAVNYPSDIAGWEYPTFPLRMLGRDEEAIANLKRALAIAPDSSYASYALAQELMMQGRLQEVPEWIDRLKQENHPDDAEEDQAILFFLRSQYAAAASEFRVMKTSQNPMRRSYSYQDLASLDAEQGHFEDAIDTLNQGMIEDASQNNSQQRVTKLLARAYLECELRRFDPCLDDVQSGLSAGPTPRHGLMADAVLGEAFAAAPAQYAPRIREELNLVARSVPDSGFGDLAELLRLRTRGELELASGQPAAALKTFEDAASKDAPAGSREYLARALVAVAAAEQDAQVAASLRRRARDAYAAVALKPAMIWCDLASYPPGFYADQLGSYIALRAADVESDANFKRAVAELANLRSEAPASLRPPRSLTAQPLTRH